MDKSSYIIPELTKAEILTSTINKSKNEIIELEIEAGFLDRSMLTATGNVSEEIAKRKAGLNNAVKAKKSRIEWLEQQLAKAE